MELVSKHRRSPDGTYFAHFNQFIQRFHRFFDLKRLNTEPEYQTTITRQFPIVNVSAEHPQQTYTLRPDSRLYIIPFPRTARDKNPNLTLNTDE